MAVELYNDGTHKCIAFYDLVSGNDGVQANQFLIVHDKHSALIDPGGELIYNELFMQSYRYLLSNNLDYVIASHQDPDIISSLNRWLVGSKCDIFVPELWSRFVPHFAPPGNVKKRIISIPDKGMDIPLGKSIIKAIPAHFMHSEGNFQFYDPISRILLSGDMGASMVHEKYDQPIETRQAFYEHIGTMEGFHRRYMSSSKICQFWVNMVRQLDIEWLVPQHGRSFKGEITVNCFLEWIEQLECGVDLMTQKNYTLP